MFGVLDTAFLQASASSLVRGYRNVRAAVGLPDGGVRNPPPLQYRPLATLARPLAGQPGGVTSGTSAGAGGVAWAGAPAGTGVVLGSGLGLAPSAGPAAAAAAAPAPAGAPRAGLHPPPSALPAGTALAASLVAAASVGGDGGVGVTSATPKGGPALPPGAWAASAALPQGVLRPADNDSLAFMPARGPTLGPLCCQPHTFVLLRAVGGDRVTRAPGPA
jgi:hypothetical protein